ncbi:MAG: hypothetical protein ACXAC2_16235, partial [Candidatus Kariarchaeaceae archaeon]
MAVRDLIEEHKYIITIDTTNIEKAGAKNEISEIDKLYYEKYKMIFLFKYYVIDTHGEDIWYELLDHRKFRRLFYYSVIAYGELIFGS